MPAVGGGGGGSGRLHQAFEGIFTPTTVRQRAFDAGSLIGLQGSSGAPVGYLAPVDIPVNSPAPGTNNALWVSFGGSFAGVDRATFDSALARKANAASLANYLRTSTYNIEKARLESGITGNDNDISALQTAINNLPSEVGDVTREQLNAAVQMLQGELENVSAPLFVYELWGTSKTTTQVRYNSGNPVDLDWTLGDDVPDALAVDGDRFLMPLFYRGHVNLELWHGETLIDKSVLEVESEQQQQNITQTSISGIRMGRFAWVLRQGTFNSEQVHQIEIFPSENGQVFLGGLQARVYAEVALSRSTVNVNLDNLKERVQSAETDIAALESVTENIPVTSDVLWATSKALTASLPAGRTVDTDWTIGDDVPTGVVADGDILDIPENFRGDLHIDFVDASDNLLQRKVIPIAIGQTGFESPFGSRLRANIAQDGTDNAVLNFSLTTQSGRAVTIPAGTVAKIYGVTALPRSQVAGITQQQLTAAIAEVDDKFGGVPLNGPDAGGFLNNVHIQNLNKYIPETNIVTVPVFNWVDLRRDPSSLGPSVGDLGQYDRILIRITFYTGSLASARRTESFDFFVNIAEWDSLTTVPFPTQALANSETGRVSIIASTKDNRALVHEFPQLAPSDVSAADTLRANQRLLYVGKSNATNPQLLLGISGTTDDFLAEVRGYH